MHDVTTLDFSRIAQDLQIRKVQVESVVGLLDEGNTVPFITRYRKERTGSLNEDIIRHIQTRVARLRQLAERKQTILKSIETQGKLTDDLRMALLKADTSKRLEDLYLPFKPKKKSLASTARERGLEPLALAIWHRDPAVLNLTEVLPTLVNPEKELATVDDVKNGVQHILAEMMAETADVRAAVRSVLWETGQLCSAKNEKLQETQGLEYKDYFKFTEPVRHIPPHRILALNRGEKEGVLKVKLEWHVEGVQQTAIRALADFAFKQLVAAKKAAQVASASPPPADPSMAVQVSSDTGTSPGQAVEGAPPTPPPVETPSPAPAAMVPPPPMLTPEQEGEALAPPSTYRTPHVALIRTVLEDALNRLLLPSLEREIRQELRDEAEDHAVVVFARNLRSLLLQPPLRNRRVLAIDPGFRTGCKIAALDEYGTLLEEGVIYPHIVKKPGKDRGPKPGKEGPPAGDAGASTPPTPPAATSEAGAAPTVSEAVSTSEVSPGPTQPAEVAPMPESPVPTAAQTVAPAVESSPPSTGAETPGPAAPAPLPEPKTDKREEARNHLFDLITRHNLNVVAIGNGTGCRETEELISDLIGTRLPDLAYVIVNEAGASVYSVSPVGREEFPDFDSTLRGTISIGRRLQDPLSELVKVDPQSIGVGLYQHDVNRKELKESLDGVVESCVNQVGVDLNTASVPLLRHVSGLNQLVARELVEYRKQHGPFQCREQLQQVPNLGPTRYVQAAGFLKIMGGTNPLDRTWIHPESFGVAEKILTDLGYSVQVLEDKTQQEEFQNKLRTVNVQDVAQRLDAGMPTVQDIVQALARPGRDPREDLPPPIFKKGILKLEDLQPGMELKGTVLNVVDFGAFVDIGLKESGLVHISEMANRYIKSPYEVVAVSDVVTVWVKSVDKDRHRVSLSMIKPGTERKPPERPPTQAGPASEGDRPPPRGDRRHGRPQDQQRQGQGPPRGGRPGGPPPRGPRPGPVVVGGTPAPAGGTATGQSGPPAARQPAGPPPRPAPPPRKPRRDPPKPKLTQEAIEGKVPLRSFGELSALFAAKKAPPPPPPKHEPPPEPAKVEPPPEPVAVAQTAIEPAPGGPSEGSVEKPAGESPN